MKSRPHTCAVLALLAAAASHPVPALAATAKPNFVLILCDDLGYNDLGCCTYPSQDHPGPPPDPSPTTYTLLPPPNPAFAPEKPGRTLTPNLDRLAASGMRFTSFYASPVCSASRASFMTGCYSARVGINGALMPTDPHGLNTTEVTLAALLKLRGYSTLCVGKWHLGHDAQFLPTRRGFDQYFGLPYSNDMTPLYLYEGEQPIEEIGADPLKQSRLTQRYTERALEFISRQKDRPFFLYLANSMPHVPVYPSPAFAGASGKGNYYDVVMEIDASVGRIVSKLRELGLETNTLILFTSDNGPWHSRPNPNATNRAVGSAYPLRGSKHTVWDGGVRVPCIVSWPGHIPPNSVSDLVGANVDVLPTFVELAGGALPSDRVIDGSSLAPVLTGNAGADEVRPDRFFFEGEGVLRAVRSGPWKLRENDGRTHLYNLDADIQEDRDLQSNRPADFARLTKLRTEFIDTLNHSRRVPGLFSEQEIVVETNQVNAAETGGAVFRLKLARAPGAEIRVDVRRFMGETNLVIAGGVALTFTPENWDRFQPVTIRAVPGSRPAGGAAMLRCSSPAFQPVRDVFVTY